MTAECRPPKGTPDGTVCWLHDDVLKQWMALMWMDERWYVPTVGGVTPHFMATDGFSFHSIAEPPADG